MNEELDSQLSAMFDDELPQGECELLARRLSRDAALQARWSRYAAIGAAVRGDLRLSCIVARQVNAALVTENALTEASLAALAARRGRSAALLWRGLAGAAVAAGVAAVSILWLQGGFSAATQALVARAPAPATTAALDTPASYVVPHPVEQRMTVPATELANYVVAHSEFSTPVSRRNLLSALMASEPAAVGSAEQSQSLGPVDDPNPHADQAR
jgi:sigma-E factor negative regulatory protein RseA